MSKSAPLILIHVSEQRQWLAEFLADIGYDVSHTGWGQTDAIPHLIVTDRPIDAESIAPFRSALEERQVGWIALGQGPLMTTPLTPPVADIRLGEDASGREVANAVELVGQIVALRSSVRREKDECQRWINLAMQDSLTQLPNRRAWDGRLATDLAGRLPLAVGLFDVDLFKQINDSAGHNMGDAVLRETAYVLKTRLRRDDFAARLGGDEFGVILRQVNRPIAIQIFERVRTAVVARLRELQLPTATLSAGFVTVGSDDPRIAVDIFAGAAKALQQAKRATRDRTMEGAVEPRNSARTK
ncbi:MAG: GGDEF domain-containing protein [Planctomycetales bacterium]|nr:GGDEF domain-containing protein [Planctomycetales bacterium]